VRSNNSFQPTPLRGAAELGRSAGVGGALNVLRIAAMLLRIGWTATLVAATTLGCASARVENIVQESTAQRTLPRLYVLVDHRSFQLPGVDYADMLRSAISAALAREHIPHETGLVTSRQPTAHDHRAEIRAYQAHAFWVLIATSGSPFYAASAPFNSKGALVGFKRLGCDVFLFDSALDKRIWQATAGNDGIMYDWTMRMRLGKMAGAIVRRLKKDKVL